MHDDDCRPELVKQPHRTTESGKSQTGRGSPGRCLDAEQTAALLEVTEDVLRHWRAIGHGPQPVPRPEGRLYRAERIEQLAAMPRLRRMLAISRTRD